LGVYPLIVHGLSANTVIGPLSYLPHNYNRQYVTIIFAYPVLLSKGNSLAHARPFLCRTIGSLKILDRTRGYILKTKQKHI